MAVRAQFPGHELTHVLQNIGVRTGAWTGIALAIAFSVWLYVANRMPSLESVALQRNVIAATVLGVIALLPVVRFLRAPGNLLVASLIGWSILTVTYRGLCMHFRDLSDRYSAPQIFALVVLATIMLSISVRRFRKSLD